MASQQWIVRLKMREVNLDGSDQGVGQNVGGVQRSLVKSANIVSWSRCYERERVRFLERTNAVDKSGMAF